MNEFVELLSRQLAGDLRALRGRARRRFADERVQRCGTIDELRAAARHALPRVMFDFVDGAANDEVTATRNRTDFGELAIVPRALVDVSDVALCTSVLGEPVAVPLLGAPMGLNGLVHHTGEAAIARAVHDAGSIYVLGAMASCTIEEVARESPGPSWFEMYIWSDRGLVRDLVERARAAGHLALVLTVDVPVAAARDRDRRNGFGLPPRVTMRSLAGGLARPRWSAQFIRHPRMSAANVAAHGGGPDDPVGITEYISRQCDPSATWEDLSWFRELWSGPLVVKGILSPADAQLAVRLGADASLSQTTADDSSITRRRPSASSRASWRRSPARPTSISTEACGGAATSSRHWRSAPALAWSDAPWSTGWQPVARRELSARWRSSPRSCAPRWGSPAARRWRSSTARG